MVVKQTWHDQCNGPVVNVFAWQPLGHVVEFEPGQKQTLLPAEGKPSEPDGVQVCYDSV